MKKTLVEHVEAGDVVDHHIVGMALIMDKRQDGAFVVLDLAIHVLADSPVAMVRVPVGTEMAVAASR